MSLEVGTRVVRGPDWKWKDQDGGEGHLGTVVTIGKGISNPAHQKIVVVCWDMGKMADYRVGFDDSYDLLVYDNAPAGIKHNGVICDECKEADIAGIRWKCLSCYDYDLCCKCYMGGMHDLKHAFMRMTIPNTAGKQMVPRSTSKKTQAKGLFPGAKICRGRDWRWQEQDGGSGKKGQVIKTADWANTQRSAVAVRWDSGGAYEYRVGHDGKVDVKCLTAAAGNGYYKDHLPRFGEIDSLEVGDRVVVNIGKEAWKTLQENHGGWASGMERYIGSPGRVVRITVNGDLRVQYPDSVSLTFNPAAVTKLTTFNAGDKVRIVSDMSKVKELQKEHGGWNNTMKKALGEEGRVLLVDADGDIKVNVGGNFWTFNPEAVIMVEKGSKGAEGVFEQDSTDDLAKLLRLLLNPLGLLDSGDLRQLVQAAASESSTEDDPRVFLQAVLDGDVNKVAEALDHDKNLVHITVKDNTPLHLASFKGHLDIVKLLLKAGARIDVEDDEGDTALANAVHQNEPDIVKYLLEHRADPNTLNSKGSRSPLHIGAAKNHSRCVKLLLIAGCNPNIQDVYGDTALHDAIQKSQQEVVELLVNAKKADLKTMNKKGFNPLHHAALVDNTQATRLLLKKQRNLVDIRKPDGYAALHVAVYNNHRNIVQILITEGKCTVDLLNDEHQTPLVLAIARGRTPIIEDLIEHGADVTSSDGDGDTCLHLAVMKHRQGQTVPDSDTLKKFRKQYQGNGITTPMTSLMCFLVQQGADVKQTNLKKLTALSYLKESAVRRVLEHIALKKKRPESGDNNLVEIGQNAPGEGGRHRVTSGSSDSGGNCINQQDQDGNVPGTSAGDTFSGVHVIADAEKEVKMVEMIGRGGFGEVWKGQWRGTPVAVKILSTDGSKDQEVDQEVAVHKRALHPNIVQLMAVGHKQSLGQALIVMQLISGKNLMQVIFKDHNPLTFQEKLGVSRDLLSAVTYLHHCKILHLDIKPQNVIVEQKTNKPYLCDLGLAHIKTRCTMSRSMATHVQARGTITYMPPESCLQAASGKPMTATTGSDVWALACTFLELFTGESVWPPTTNQMALCCRFLAGNVMPDNVEKLDGKIKSILKPCFQSSPSVRPSAEEMMQQFSGLI